ncbi:hypothetical protein [Flammeovirga aprica]|uniref:Uncharacterized protein n=1 Tax=Flammeovirga aprica JL-4 TaxID=694437 RepID=A0A7X9P0P0_9BACT|nr:hypothetical protein [Flammeovirga aprica]NME67358.1 hypothetical protein [Flammeovirga aprica JL-4]
MNFDHFYSRYGLAALVYNNQQLLEKSQGFPLETNLIELDLLKRELERALGAFRIYTDNDPLQDNILNYSYYSYQEIKDKNIKGNPDKGVYLAPNVISTNKEARHALGAVENLLKDIANEQKKISKKGKMVKLSKGVCAVSGQFNNGKRSQSPPSVSLLEGVCSAITTLTLLKPYLTTDLEGTAIIPDLKGIEDMFNFIGVFNNMNRSQTAKLKQSVIVREGNSNRNKVEVSNKKDKTKPKYKRPAMFNGNFPNAPKTSSMGAVALLGAIGEWAKTAEGERTEVLDLLEKLKGTPFYIIRYSSTHTVTFSHHIIDLAKAGKLSSIVDALYYSQIPEKNRIEYYKSKEVKSAYDHLDRVTANFLQLFSAPYFKDFLAVRATYSFEVKTLFHTYFSKMKNIPKEIISSAEVLGSWLNSVAFFAAKEEANKHNELDKVYKLKSKYLTQIESAIYSAKEPSDLVAHVLTRASRLTNSEVGESAKPFIGAVLSGDIDISDAKNIMVAYARIRGGKSDKEGIVSLNNTQDTTTSVADL